MRLPNLNQIKAFLLTPAEPALAPYHLQRSPLQSAVRQTKLFSALVLIGIFYGFFYVLLPPAFLLFLIAPIGLLLFIVVWALPDRDALPPVKLLHDLFFGFSIAAVIWPTYIALALPGLPWITAIRAFSLPMTILLLVSVSTSAAFRATMKNALASSPVIVKFLLIFVAVQVLTIPFSSTPFTTLKIVMGAQFEWIAAFFAAVFVFLKPGRARLWVTIICSLAFAICVIGYLESRYGGVLWVGHIPSLLRIDDPAVQRALAGAARSAVRTHRVQSVFGVSLNLSEFLGLMTPFLLFFLVTTKNMVLRVFLAGFLGFTFYIILLSQSRLGVVGYLGSFLLFLMIWSVTRWRRDKSDLLGPAVVFAYPAIFILFMVATVVVGRLNNLIWGSGAHQASNQSRMDQLADALPLVAQWPFGYGAGRAGGTLGYSAVQGRLTIDSYFLTIILDYGVIGMIAFYGMTITAAVKAFAYSTRARDKDTVLLNPLAIAITMFLVMRLVLSQEQSNPLVFVMLGMTVALIHRATQAERQHAGPAK